MQQLHCSRCETGHFDASKVRNWTLRRFEGRTLWRQTLSERDNGHKASLEDSEDEQQSEERASAADDDISSKEQELERLTAVV